MMHRRREASDTCSIGDISAPMKHAPEQGSLQYMLHRREASDTCCIGELHAPMKHVMKFLLQKEGQYDNVTTQHVANLMLIPCGSIHYIN